MDYIADSSKSLKEWGNFYREKYLTNPPFPNIAIDQFFNPRILEKILEEFPDLNKDKGDIHYINPNENKLASSGEGRFGPYTRNFLHFLNSEPFLEFLQELSGIQETLIPDPYFIGGGCHQIKPGGFLKLHVDFHKHKTMNLDRRLNVLVYLNKDWKEEYGGHFELWEKDKSKSVVRILPVFNRMAIFSTTGFSWHGHPDPLTCPPERTRQSLALYYYTNGRPEGEVSIEQSQRITTTFASRKNEDNTRMKVYNFLVNLANDITPPIVIKTMKKYRKT